MKKLQKIPMYSLRDRKRPAIFGRRLDEFLPTECVEGVPLPVYRGIEYMCLEDRIREEGIFRLSGVQSEIRNLKALYDRGDDPDLNELYGSPHVVTGMLKLFFRELAEPLLTFELYDCFIVANAIQFPERRMDCIKTVLGFLPPENFTLLLFLVKFLRVVVEYSDENKMNSSNIAKVFAPNLLRAEHMDTAMFLEETPQAARLLEALIDNYDFFLMDHAGDVVFDFEYLVKGEEPPPSIQVNRGVDIDAVLTKNRYHPRATIYVGPDSPAAASRPAADAPRAAAPPIPLRALKPQLPPGPSPSPSPPSAGFATAPSLRPVRPQIDPSHASSSFAAPHENVGKKPPLLPPRSPSKSPSPTHWQSKSPSPTFVQRPAPRPAQKPTYAAAAAAAVAIPAATSSSPVPPPRGEPKKPLPPIPLSTERLRTFSEPPTPPPRADKPRPVQLRDRKPLPSGMDGRPEQERPPSQSRLMLQPDSTLRPMSLYAPPVRKADQSELQELASHFAEISAMPAHRPLPPVPRRPEGIPDTVEYVSVQQRLKMLQLNATQSAH